MNALATVEDTFPTAWLWIKYLTLKCNFHTLNTVDKKNMQHFILDTWHHKRQIT